MRLARGMIAARASEMGDLSHTHPGASQFMARNVSPGNGGVISEAGGTSAVPPPDRPQAPLTRSPRPEWADHEPHLTGPGRPFRAIIGHRPTPHDEGAISIAPKAPAPSRHLSEFSSLTPTASL